VTTLPAVFLLILVGTEYCIFSRRRTLVRLSAPVSPWMVALRLLLWTIVWFCPLSGRGIASAVVGWLACVSVCEIVAYTIHRRMAREVAEGNQCGSVPTHLLPVLVAVAVGAPRFASRALLASSAFFYPPMCLMEPRFVAFAAASVLLFSWSTLFAVSVVALTRSDSFSADGDTPLGTGELIGVLERLVVFLLVMGGALTAVGFVVAAKSAARFPRFQHQRFAEYFLIGTLCSVGVATLVGMWVSFS